MVAQSPFEGQWGFSPWEPVASKSLGGKTWLVSPAPTKVAEPRKMKQESLVVRG